MKKRFTLLFAALLAFVGVAKADFQLTYSCDADFWGSTLTEYPTEIAGLLTSESFTSAAVRCHDEAVVVTGDVTVVFEHVTGKGDHKQHILGVVLKNAEGVVKADYHYGTHPGTNNTYTLSGVEAGEYTLSMYVSNNGGDNVNNFGGTITVTGAKIHAASGVVTSIEDLSNDKLYAIVPKDNTRGALYATSTSAYLDACGGTRTNAANPNVTIDATSPEQQFAIYKHNEVMYLYSVGAGKFVSDISGNLFPLVETPRHNIALEVSAEAGYFIIKAKGSEFINVSTGHTAGCVAGWNSVDDGNKLQITEVAAMPEATLTQLKDAFAAAEAALLPEVSTEAAPRYYTIGSYDRGGFLTNMGSGKGVEHVTATTNSLWYFTKANDNGGVYICNKNGGYLDANKQVSENKAVWYVLSNGVNLQGAVISSAKPISGNCCIDAKNNNTGVGGYAPKADDWKGTTWVFAESNVVTYEYTYGDKVYTQELIAAKGGAYPDYRLPHGVVAAEAKPEGVVDGDTKVTRELAFSFPVSDENSTKAVMIGAHNSEAFLWRAVGDGITVQKNATANSENYYWAIYPTFAENSLAYTVTIKNLGTGKYIYSTSDANSHDAGVVTLADEGSVFTLESGNQFKLATDKYLSINSANVDTEQILGTCYSHGGTKNKFVDYPGLDAEVKAAFIEKFAAFDALKEGEALSKLTTMKAQWDNVAVVVAPMSKAIEAGDFVKKADVVAATESMATVTTAVEPVLAYFNGDYKTTSDKVKAFFGKLEEDSEAHTALAAAIATFEAVADVTTVEALEAKVAAVNTAYDEQYEPYDLSEVWADFLYQAEMFEYLAEDESLNDLLMAKNRWNGVKTSNDEIKGKVEAEQLVLKGDVEYAIEDTKAAAEFIESILTYYNETYKPTLDYAEAILIKYEASSDEYNSLAPVIETAKADAPNAYSVEDLKSLVANLKANEVYALYDIDAPITTGEEGWVDITRVEEGSPVIDNPGFKVLDAWVINQKIINGEESEDFADEDAYNQHDAEWSVLEILPAADDMTGKKAVVNVKQWAYTEVGVTYRLSGKAYHKGATNAVFFVGDEQVEIPEEEWITFENAPDKFWDNYTVVIEFEAGSDYLPFGYGCEFESADAALYVSDLKLEKIGTSTYTLRERFQEVYQGNMMQGVTGFSMLKVFEPYRFLEAMHPAYDVLYAEVDAIYGAMWEGVPTDTATVAKAIRSMEAMKADFDAVANYLMSDDYWNTTQEALTVIEDYMEESDVYAQLMEAYNAAKGVVYYEEEVDGKIEVMAKYYATFTSVADIEDALEALANALEDAEAKIPTEITLDEEEVELNGEPTVQLTATVKGSETADKSVFWVSDEEEVATVDENGLVTAVGEGEAYIIAYSIHKNVSAKCEVTVTALTDGIDGFEVKVETVIYDIHGRQVEKMEKGFYIVNGKKVLVK